MPKKQSKKQAWWLSFADGSIKKVFTETMTEAWERGTKMGTPLSISGSKTVAESNVTPPYEKEKSLTKGADPAKLIGMLKYLTDPYVFDPHAGDDMPALIYHMQHVANECLHIVENFPKVIIE